MIRRFYVDEIGKLESIGRVILDFSLLEELIRSSVGRLIDDEFKIRQMITDKLQFHDLLELFDSIYRHKVKDHGKINELNDLLNRAREAYEKRHNIIVPSRANMGHNLYDSIGFGHPRKKFESKLVILKANELDDISDFIYGVATDISEFMLLTVNSGELG